jgi:hypothetical protein
MAPPDLYHRSSLAGRQWGKIVQAPSTGGVDGPVAAKAPVGAAGPAVGASGMAKQASGGTTGGQQKVTSLR